MSKSKGERVLFGHSQFRLLHSGFTVVVALLLLAACATMKPEDSDTWRNAQRPVIKQRAEARWVGLIKGDIEKAYSYTSPDYRAVVTLQQFKGKYGRVVDWRVAHANDISYDSPTVASVSVEVTYRVDLPGVRGKEIETNRVLTEKWLFKNGEWWYTNQ